MEQKFNCLVNALYKLKLDSISHQNDLQGLMKTYDMMFLGNKFNEIDTIELLSTLKNKFGLNIEHEELLKMIPIACKSLNMSFTAGRNVNSLASSEIACYNIILWQ